MNFDAHYEREGTTGWPIKSWEDANTLLGYQNADGPSYTIFTLNTGSYIQCAGGKKQLVVEARVVNDNGGFNHFRFGKGNPRGQQQTIECSCGPIIVDQSEVLAMRDARLIIRYFVENDGKLLGKYNAADITQMFQ